MIARTHRPPHPSAADRAASRWAPTALEQNDAAIATTIVAARAHCAGCRCFTKPAPPPPPPPVLWAVVESIKPTRYTRDLRVHCPFCGKLHLHGLPFEETAKVTSRGSHCADGSGGDYRVRIPAWAHRLERPGRRDGGAA